MLGLIVGVVALITFCLVLGYFTGFYSVGSRRREEGRKESDDLIRMRQENKGLYENMGSMETILSSKEKDLFAATEKLKELEARIIQEEDNSKKILSMKKSSEIRTGHIAEQLAPFLTGFNHDPRNIRYLGQPIDYVIFDKDDIIFLEVKSGKSHLSHNQKRIRQLVENKRIRWEEFRVRGSNEWKPRKQFKKFPPRGNGNGS